MAGGGFNVKAIKTKASMQRVHGNGSEFGHCSQVDKAFRMALQECQVLKYGFASRSISNQILIFPKYFCEIPIFH